MHTTYPGTSTSAHQICALKCYSVNRRQRLCRKNTYWRFYIISGVRLCLMRFFGEMLLLSLPNLFCADFVFMLARNVVRAKMAIINSVHILYSNNNLFHAIRLTEMAQSQWASSGMLVHSHDPIVAAFIPNITWYHLKMFAVICYVSCYLHPYIRLRDLMMTAYVFIKWGRSQRLTASRHRFSYMVAVEDGEKSLLS